jgi:hypothetical protein
MFLAIFYYRPKSIFRKPFHFAVHVTRVLANKISINIPSGRIPV